MAIVPSTEILRIVNGLLASTEEGRTTWESFADSKYEYTTDTDKFTFFLKSRDEDDAPPHLFQVYKNGPQGGPIVDVSSGPDEADLFNAMKQLYTAAKLSAYGIRSLADEVLRDLE